MKGSDGTGGAVGGAIGGFVALLAIIASITCVVVVVVRSRSKQKPTGIQENDGMEFSNVIIYELKEVNYLLSIAKWGSMSLCVHFFVVIIANTFNHML